MRKRAGGAFRGTALLLLTANVPLCVRVPVVLLFFVMLSCDRRAGKCVVAA